MRVHRSISREDVLSVYEKFVKVVVQLAGVRLFLKEGVKQLKHPHGEH